MIGAGISLGAAQRAGRGARLGRRLRQSRAAYLLLAPFLVLFVLVLAYPLLFSLYLSFFDATLNQTPVFVGAANFVQLVSDGEFRTALGNTVYFAVFAVMGEAVLPLLVALAMNERLPFRAVLRTAYFLPVVTSWTVVSLIWTRLFAQQGLANSVLHVLGLPSQPFFADPQQARWILIGVAIWRNLGIYMVVYLAALQGVPQ